MNSINYTNVLNGTTKRAIGPSLCLPSTLETKIFHSHLLMLKLESNRPKMSVNWKSKTMVKETLINSEKMEILQLQKLIKNKREVETEKNLKIPKITKKIIQAFTIIQLMSKIAKKITKMVIRAGSMIVLVKTI